MKSRHGVRRNLSFDDSNFRRTPRKKFSVETPKKGAKTPKKTPKKTQKKHGKDFNKYIILFYTMQKNSS